MFLPEIPASRIAATWAIAILCAIPPAWAATWYVAVDGSDTGGDDSPGNPFATMTRAVDGASGGDEVIVRPGTFNGRQRLRRELDVPVVVRSEVPYAAKLRHNAGAALIAFTARNVVIEVKRRHPYRKKNRVPCAVLSGFVTADA